MNLRIVLRPICWVYGHKRGYLIGEQASGQQTLKIYACPRCFRQKSYKVRPK